MRSKSNNNTSLNILVLCVSGIAAVIVGQWLYQWALIVWPL